MKTTIAIIVLGLLATAAANAQPANQVGAILMCPTGQVDANSNPYVVPCGYAVAPIVTQVVGPMPTTPTTQCPSNPLTKKVPPLC